jgi:uncharacterized protein YqgQ
MQKLLTAHGGVIVLFKQRKDDYDTMLRFVYKSKIKIKGRIVAETWKKKEKENLRGSAYDLRPQDKTQMATLCSLTWLFTIYKSLFIIE